MEWIHPLRKVASKSQNDFGQVRNHSPVQEESPMPQVSVHGSDIAKQIFQVVGLDDTGKVVLRKRLEV